MIKLIFEDTDLFQKYAILENNSLLYLEVVEKDRFASLGDIYLGRVKNVVKGLEAAFLDLGEGVGFLPIKKDKLVQGDSVLVQVIKEGNDSKKPKLSKDIMLKGRYVIYVPFEDEISISKKLTDADAEVIVDNLKLEYPKKGIIIRTQAKNIDYNVIKQELDLLIQKYQDIIEVNRVGCLHTDNNPEFKIAEFIDKYKVNEITTNDFEFYKRNKISYFREDITLKHQENYCFNYNGINLQNLMNQHIKFDKFSLFVQKTEAMTVVDIDSGHIKDTKLMESLIYDINLAALEKILELLEILDIGGIIIVDLINMTDENKERLDFKLQNMLKSQRKKVKISPITKSNLLEIIRQKSTNSIIEKLTKPCEICSGSGRTYKDKFILDEFELDLKNNTSSEDFTEIKIISNEVLYKRLLPSLEKLANKYNCSLSFINSDDYKNKIKIIN